MSSARLRLALLIAVLAVGLAARLLATWQFLDSSLERGPVYDEAYYINVAHSIAAGRGHSLGAAEDPTPGALRPPLYPAFLAGLLLLLGHHITALWAGQIATSLLTVWLVFRICERRFGTRAAAVSGLACALAPSLVHYSHFFWGEGFAATLLTLCFWLLDRYDRSGRLRDLALVGVALGLTALTKQVWLYFGLVVMGWVAWRARFRWRRALPAALVLALAMGAVIAPWTLRNHRVEGRLVLISTIQWFPIAFGNFFPSDRWFLGTSTPEQRQALMAEAKRVPRAEREAFWRGVAIELIRAEQPWWIFKKLVRGPAALYSARSQQLRFLHQGWVVPSRAGALLLIATDVLGYLLTMLPGLVALWVVPGGRLKVLVVLALLQLTAVHVVASSNARYYVTVLPLIVLYVGPLATGAFERERVRRWQWAGAAASTAAFLALTLPRSLPFLAEVWARAAALE